MRYLINKSTDPYFNLALDEYAMTNIDVNEDFFFIWQNAPSVIIGKNQNASEEVNQRFLDENGVNLARRVSGGGAVYHDFGNINYTFIIPVDDPATVDFKKYTQPIVDALASMGVHAEATGRNDVTIDGKKISGTAQRMANGKLMFHGTLMYEVDSEALSNALNVDPDKIVSKGFKSVKSRVTNIKEHLPEGSTFEEFFDKLQYFLSNEGKDEEIVLTDEDIAKVQKAADERFSTWEWIYGKSPEFNLKNKKRFPGGKVEVLMDVDEGLIKSVRFMGDYLGLKDVLVVEEALLGVRFNRQDVEEVLNEIPLTEYFGKITKDEILELIFD